MMQSPRIVLALPLVLAGTLFAHDEHVTRAWIEPGRDHWVTSPVPLRISFFDAGAKELAKIRSGSIRIRIDGVDVTAPFLALATGSGGVAVEDAGRTVVLSTTVPFAHGTHRVQVDYVLSSGGRKSFEQAFTVYDPEQIRRDLGIAPKLPKRGVDPLLVETGARAPQAPPVWLTPFDKGFVTTATTDLRVTWSRGGAGMQMKSMRILLDNTDVTSNFAVGATGAVWKGAQVKNGKRTLVAQVADSAGNLRVETSTFIVFDGSKRKPWFYAPTNQNHPFSHTHHQFQNYGSGSSSAYFHHGCDINRPAGSRVYACEGGKITNFYWYGRQPYYFEIEVTDADGFRWQYHHVDYPKIPSSVVQIGNQRGTIARGRDIGANVYWPVRAYGKLFHHIHLNVIAPDGRYVNPMNLLLTLQDKVKPQVQNIYITPNASSTVLNRGGVSGATVGGKLDFVARAQDLVGTEPYQLTVYRMTWELRELTGTKTHHVPETELWRFDYLPGGGNRFGGVWDIFRYRLNDYSTLYTRGNYSSRTFYYVLTNRTGDTTVSDSAGYWDSARKGIDGPLFPNGRYQLDVRAYDIAGNSGSKSITFNLRN